MLGSLGGASGTAGTATATAAGAAAGAAGGGSVGGSAGGGAGGAVGSGLFGANPAPGISLFASGGASTGGDLFGGATSAPNVSVSGTAGGGATTTPTPNTATIPPPAATTVGGASGATATGGGTSGGNLFGGGGVSTAQTSAPGGGSLFANAAGLTQTQTYTPAQQEQLNRPLYELMSNWSDRILHQQAHFMRYADSVVRADVTLVELELELEKLKLTWGKMTEKQREAEQYVGSIEQLQLKLQSDLIDVEREVERSAQTHTHTQQFTHIGIRGFGADQVAHKAASLARQLHELELQVHALTCEVNELQENKMSPATPEGAVLVSLNRHQLSIKIMKHRADEIDARMEQLERSRGK
eukprot:GHVR01165280.1.p1 GENE.GHVR01165280.1~~GHVR01165280.1.p1  ORF type:complete len:356 (+),score=139.20 GHVR01165280.1:404-1471(+)